MAITLGALVLAIIIAAVLYWRRTQSDSEKQQPAETSPLLCDTQQSSFQSSPESQRLKNQLEGAHYKTRDVCSETVSERNWKCEKNDMVQI